MKLLLTSAGLSSPPIRQALNQLTGKQPSDIHVAFIPTAINVEPGDKTPTIKNLNRLKDYGAGTIDIVDISSIPRSLWQPRLEAADVLFFAGGNPYYLMDCVKRCGLTVILPDLLATRVYVGHSAGSAIAGTSLAFSSPKAYMPESASRDMPGLGLTRFCIRTHLHAPHVQDREIHDKAILTNLPVYAIDDQTALKVVNEDVEIVGAGKYLKLNLPD